MSFEIRASKFENQNSSSVSRSGIRDSEYKIRDRGFGIPDWRFDSRDCRDSNFEFQNSSSGFEIWEFESWDSRFGIRDSRLGIRDSRLEIRESRLQIRNSRFESRASRFEIRDMRVLPSLTPAPPFPFSKVSRAGRLWHSFPF